MQGSFHELPYEAVRGAAQGRWAPMAGSRSGRRSAAILSTLNDARHWYEVNSMAKSIRWWSTPSFLAVARRLLPPRAVGAPETWKDWSGPA
jgi:hypothetical protein